MHRFVDPELTLLMRTGQRPGDVVDTRMMRGLILIHLSDVERLAALTAVDGTVIGHL